MKTITATVVKNEADRYWRSALEAWTDFSDAILVLDDDSDDETKDIAAEYEEVVFVEPNFEVDGSMWGHEAPYRKCLWQFALDVAEPGDIIFWLDADMAPTRDPTKFFEQDADLFCFPLYDLWATDETHMVGQYGRERFNYRHEPPYWRAHENPRTWAVRVPEGAEPDRYEWGTDAGIHSGHIPIDFAIQHNNRLMVPRDHGLTHWGYFDPADRKRKHEAYMEVADQLSDFQRKHAETILDESPRLKPLYRDLDYVLEKP